MNPKTELPKDITDKLIENYGIENFFDALHLLTLQGEFANRVIRRIIYLAHKDYKRLMQFTQYARLDYRDVIYWAEYIKGEDKDKPKRARNFNKPFGQAEL
ncbi:MAG: hypothetical protein GWO07_09595 [Candidatus Dadabacteria bacterium]|nr:hypothetical protein [Candidatus Dadabacteria bacterium]NIS09000.1 hypothetical protein [Candidatus Dadabacteria bacterium]NIV41042.1 hypothetical protein [Candidatus Dadabacteria bacterium]NIX15602.1 hypothetical protein [Candidatus Dadabacteria bacterium]NIY22343.1 hypothetical protein [Candidatus Dadabacteria bacterium]